MLVFSIKVTNTNTDTIYKGGDLMSDVEEKVMEALNEIRPALQADRKSVV